MKNIREKTITFLRWSEQYTHTDMIYLFTGSFWSTLRQVLAALSVLLTSIIFARFVNQEVYGTYKYLQSMATVISSFLLIGLSVGATRYVSLGHRKVLQQVFKLNIIWSLPAMIISLGMGAYYFQQENITLAFGLAAISIFIPIIYAAMNYGAYLIGVKDFRLLTILTTTVSLGSALATIGAVFTTNSPLSIFLTYLVSNTILNLLAYWYTTHVYAREGTAAPSKELLIYSIHNSIINVLPNIAGQADKIFVFQQLGASELAIYSFAIAIPDQLIALFGNVSRIAFPKYASKSLEEIKSHIWWKMAGFTILTLLGSIVYILIAPFVYKILFPHYMDSVFYSQIISLFLFTSLANIPLAILQAKARFVPLYTNTLFTSIVQIILNFFLINHYGLIGAIFSNSLTRVVTLLAALFTIWKLPQEPISTQK